MCCNYFCESRAGFKAIVRETIGQGRETMGNEMQQ